MKFAAHIGNGHISARVTPFFTTAQEAKEAAKKSGHGSTYVAGCSNWEQHMEWNRQGLGMYASSPVAE